MIGTLIAAQLTEQIGWELGAHQLYTGMAIYFERQSLARWGKFFRDQAVEEAQHATKIMAFLIDNGVEFDLPAMAAATTHYESALAVARTAADAERRVSERFRSMASTALAEGDHTSHQFLGWFIDEQVEEERMAQSLLDLIGSGVNLFQAEPLLDGLS